MISTLFTGFSLGCLTLVFIIVFRDFRKFRVAQVFMALLVSASAYIISGVVAPDYRWLTGDIMTMLPALFWLLCQLAFARRPNLKSTWSLLCVYSFVAPAITRSLGSTDEASGNLYLWFWHIPRTVEYLLLLNGIWVVLANWKDDLISGRRKLRAALLFILGTTGLVVTISLNTGNGDSIILPVVVTLCSLFTAVILLQGRDHIFELVSADPSNQPAIKLIEKSETVLLDKTAMQLTELMKSGFYRTEKLTLKILSSQLELPEYKTRELINKTFKYRNFNDYINQLRIEEASTRLVTEPDTPIQNISLDVGYRTLSSFNRAFKEITKQTPTNFRLSKK